MGSDKHCVASFPPVKTHTVAVEKGKREDNPVSDEVSVKLSPGEKREEKSRYLSSDFHLSHASAAFPESSRRVLLDNKLGMLGLFLKLAFCSFKAGSQ